MRAEHEKGQRGLTLWAVAGVLAVAVPAALSAQTPGKATLSYFGTTGLIDMPTAESQPDGEISTTVSNFSGQTRTTLTFQVTPRLSASFRYSILRRFSPGNNGALYDRSFDLGYRFFDETRYRPALSVGVRDFGGTGVYGGEYVAATKTITPALKLTGGIGWGRLGSYNGFTNPLGILDNRFETRPPKDVGKGGTFSLEQWFRGEAAFFGGVEWKATDKLTLKAEYSSDAYVEETRRGMIRPRSPFNFGVQYQIQPGVDLGVHYLYGSEIGVMANFAFNPKTPAAPSGFETAPMPVLVRPERNLRPEAWSTDWTEDIPGQDVLRTNIQTVLAEEGLELESYRVTATSIEIRFRNYRYPALAQAIGRAARGLTRGLPASIETLTLIPVTEGLPTSAVSLKRSDIEALENAPDGSRQIYDRAQIDDAYARGNGGFDAAPDYFPKLTWGLGPYVQASFFDPDDPFRADLGAELSGRYEPRPGVVFSGALRKTLVGNLDEITRVSNSVLPHVRTDFARYAKEGDPAVSYLTGEYFFRPGSDLYGRLTLGYLEPMYAGLSGEILWKSIDSSLGVGLEANYARKRDYDQLFGLQDYDIVTGNASAYYSFRNGFSAQIDAGRYLAGDWGATFTLQRNFRNGWKVGAFATLTDVSFEDFGEGSFDKGILIEAPLSWVLGRPNTRSQTMILRPLTRDGGARLNVRNRLYELVADQGNPGLRDQWGRFWR